MEFDRDLIVPSVLIQDVDNPELSSYWQVVYDLLFSHLDLLH